jgi:hypothetical protein
LSAIGHQGVFRLRGWSPQIRTGFLGPRATWEHAREFTPFRLRGCHPLCRTIQSPSTMTRIFDSLLGRQSELNGPTTPIAQRLPAITRDRFSLFRFRSPLLTESRLLSLPEGTEMFHFPMCSGMGNWACPQLGFPIRKSSNHSSVASSSRLIAGSYVLHRLLVPRHPPCALKNLTTDIRCSRPLCSSQATGETVTPSPAPARCCGRFDRGSVRRPARGPTPEGSGIRPFPQDPTACQAIPLAARRFRTAEAVVLTSRSNSMAN